MPKSLYLSDTIRRNNVGWGILQEPETLWKVVGARTILEKSISQAGTLKGLQPALELVSLLKSFC